ncbi:conserved hypothetical protein [Candidatus Desulfarcum epimagneticum]|uniref:Antitoxin n=1 Tax=uncultured Desulfobacteraceae bacterium TaxID=218296 RepID=A0A484HKH1_9BACT|nr:conserved hypothetical protein [uncultured Desulfobacteraceae bacterium]
MKFPDIDRITIDPNVMGGKPCIRGMRVTAGAITGLVASGASFHEILELYPYIDKEDIKAALAYATWRTEEFDLSLDVA